MQRETVVSEEMSTLSAYVASMANSDIPEEVRRNARCHLLDTIASIVSGSELLAGRKAAEFIQPGGDRSEALIVGTELLGSTSNAAMANGMSAHADETDDSHPTSHSHPGCSIVPAALAAAERQQVGGDALLRAIITGYDVGCRISQAVGRQYMDLRNSAHSSHALVGAFGSAAATAVIEEFNEQQVRHTLSYAAQMASGVTSWLRDKKHVEKAYVFGGMPARNGVAAALMVASGFEGVEDVFSGHPNFLDAWSPNPDRKEIIAGLGQRYEVTHTNIKKYCVGSPAQAAIQAIVEIIEKHCLSASEVDSIKVGLPSDAASVVDNRAMPDINLQYLLAGTLVDGEFSFKMAHDYRRMQVDKTIHVLTTRIGLEPDDELALTRQAKLWLRTIQGAEYRRHIAHVRGTVGNPMNEAEVDDKAEELSTPVLGVERTLRLIELVHNIERVANVVELRSVLCSSDDVPRSQIF